MRQKRGVSLVEGLLAASLIAFCLLVFLSVTVGGLRQSTRSREQILADQLMQNTCEEILGERFGDTTRWWGDGTPGSGDVLKQKTTQQVVLQVNLEGLHQDTSFYRRVEQAPQQGGTGSFFGTGKSTGPQWNNYDVVKISLYWWEASGPSSQSVAKTKVGYLTVWRGFGAR